MTNLKYLNGELVELGVPVYREHELSDHMAFRVSVIGRVKIYKGDRDCPEHIYIGHTVLPIDAVIEYNAFGVHNQYKLVLQ